MAVSLMIVVFINVYANSIDQHRITLDELYANIEVTGYIANMEGSIDGLKIEDKITAELERSGFIKEGVYTLTTSGILGHWHDDNAMLVNYTANIVWMEGTNSVSTLPQQPEFMDGFDEEVFKTSDNVCIVSDVFLDENFLVLGSHVDFTAIEIKNYPIASESDFLHDHVTLEIVGVYQTHVSPSPIYCPFEVTTNIFRNLDKPLAWNSARFFLQNTQELNRFRDLLRDLGFANTQVSTERNKDDLSFIINDRILKKATSSVQGYIDFSSILFPVIYIFCAGIGFVVSYLVIRIRKPEYAVMRSLGTSRTTSFFTLFTEQGLLCLIGAMLGLGISRLITGHASTLQIVAGLGYVVFYLIGAGLAVMTMNQVNVIKILTAKE